MPDLSNVAETSSQPSGTVVKTMKIRHRLLKKETYLQLETDFRACRPTFAVSLSICSYFLLQIVVAVVVSIQNVLLNAETPKIAFFYVNGLILF